jgi:hypothetical protein
MKRLVLGLALGAWTACFSTPALGQTRPGFEVGLEVFQIGYMEFDEGDLFIRQDGRMVGLNFSYVQPITGSLFGRATISGAAGSVDYDPLDEPVVEDVKQSQGRFEIHLGYDFMLKGGASITPFAGYGYRLHEDHAEGVSTVSGLEGFDREIEYDYLPVGVASSIPVGGRKRLNLSAQYNHLIGGQVNNRFSLLDPDLPDVALDFNGGHGLEASAMLALPVGRRHALNVGPFIRSWKIAQSDSFTIVNPDDPTEAIVLFEPENRTTELGVRLSFSF